MAKVIKITTDNKVEIIDMDFSKSAETVNKGIREHIKCDHYSTYPPYEYLKEFDTKPYNYDKNKKGLLLLIDDEGRIKQTSKINVLATDIAGTHILGDCLLVGTELLESGEFDYSEIDEEYFDIIIEKLNEDAELTNAFTKVLNAELECVACVKLNYENGGTLPIVCPKTQMICSSLSRWKLLSTTKGIDEIDGQEKPLIEIILNRETKDWLKNGHKKNYALDRSSRILKYEKAVIKEIFGDKRININDTTLLYERIIEVYLDLWDRFVKEGRKDIYIFDRH